MATEWQYAISAAVYNVAFANQLWGVIWSSAPSDIRGSNSNTFNAQNAYRDTNTPGQGPDAYVIASRLKKAQRDELVEFLGGANPARWISEGLTAAQLNNFRSNIVAVVGEANAIEAGHAAFISSLDLVPVEL